MDMLPDLPENHSHVLICCLALLMVRNTEVLTGMTWPTIRREMRVHVLENF